jgi:glycosyltransferase 2 family protein
MRTSDDIGVAARPAGIRRAPRLFSTPADAPRARRASDGIKLTLATLGTVVLGLTNSPPAGFVRALTTFLTSWPAFLDGLWLITIDLLHLFAIVVIVISMVRRRWSLTRDLVLSAFVALAVALLVGRVVDGSWPAIWDSLLANAPPAWFPSQRLAVPSAILMVASPYVSLPIRRLSRWMVAGAAFALCCLGAATPVGVVAGVLVATIAAALIHLALGSCAGRPGLGDVAAALKEFGIRVDSVDAAVRQTAGVFLVDAEDQSGPLVVKVYGRDAHDTQLLSSMWRAVWYRSAETSFAVNRIQHVEHEAFLTLLAAQAGITTDAVVTAGETTDGDALLVLRPRGVRLEALRHDRDGTDHSRRAAALWATLDQLHAAGISHGQLDDRHVIVDGDVVGLIDFRGAIVAPDRERLIADRAQALVTTVMTFGDDVAVRVAFEALGAERLGEVVPYLQPPALTPSQRGQVRDSKLDLDDLRDRTAALSGVDSPELRKLLRVSWGAVFRTAMMFVAFAALAIGFTKLDFGALGPAIREADWWWVGVAAIVAQLPRVTQSVSTLGACPTPLPLGPVYALQLSISYVNLAVPTSAARVAVNVRFFQRHGLPTGSAVAIGALDGLSGFVVQIMLLLGLLMFTPASLDVNLDLSLSGGAGGVLLIVALIVLGAVGLVAAVPKWRRAVVGGTRRLLIDAMSALRGLQSPRRIGMLIGGNLATELLFASALGMFTRSMGYPIGLGELLLINLSVALLSGVAPVPGGIGVTEGGLMFGLVRAGMPDEAALAAVMMYRLATFYLPPIWGFFAFRWLERNRHL